MVNEFFKDEKSMYVFLLTKVEGKKRNNVLGITKCLYYDKQKATEWYNKIMDVFNINGINDEVTKKAIIELNEIYNNMIDYYSASIYYNNKI